MKNIKKAIMHLKEDQIYPATREDLIEACENLSDFSEEDKEWFIAHLPEGPGKDGIYRSAGEVIQALGWQAQPVQKSAM